MYTKEQIDVWLGPLTNPAAADNNRRIVRMTSQIWTFRWGDDQWTGACDGSALVLVAGEYGYDVAPADGIAKWLTLLPEQRGMEVVVALKRLREFIGEAPEEGWEERSAVRIAGIRVDKHRVAHALRGCRDADVTISGRGEHLYVRSEGLRVVVLCLEETEPVFKLRG